MRRTLATLAMAALSAAAHGGSNVHVAPMSGTTWSPVLAGPAGSPYNLYDNVPTSAGGSALPGLFGPGGDQPGTFAYVDWTAPSASWGDDAFVSLGGAPSAVVTALFYGYRNNVDVSTHTIRFYSILPPLTLPGIETLITKGDLLGSIVLPAQPATGGASVLVTGLSIELPHSAVWVKFNESGPGATDTFWLTGGIPGTGFSWPGLDFSIYYKGGGAYNRFIYETYFYFVDTGYVYPNIAMGLAGYTVPAPAVITGLGVAGLLVLSRQRARPRASGQ